MRSLPGLQFPSKSVLRCWNGQPTGSKRIDTLVHDLIEHAAAAIAQRCAGAFEQCAGGDRSAAQHERASGRLKRCGVLVHRREEPHLGGEVLAAGRARWLASNSYASHMPLSVNGQMGASMVRCAGRSVRH